ncbi:MAG: DUF5131 family protein [Planctomycetaceae bacterium]|nr:DUF5131 family protein [Planctomycetaceae bacterium]
MSINPLRARHRETGAVGHYCEKISGGCTNCYSSNFQKRFHMPAFGGGQYFDQVEHFLDPTKLREVTKRKKPTKWFWCDMTDMFGHWVPDAWIDECFAAMALSMQHTHQVLTKRIDRAERYLAALQAAADDWKPKAANGQFAPSDVLNLRHLSRHQVVAAGVSHTLANAFPDRPWPLPCVWLGTSVEDQKRADERIPHLVQCPAAVRFLSCEPLLGPLDLAQWLAIERDRNGAWRRKSKLHEEPQIGWVIVGGESGHGARPCDIAWIRDIVAQCAAAGVPCFVKQLGAVIRAENAIDPIDQFPGEVSFRQGNGHDVAIVTLKDSKGGDWDEWPADLRVRQFPANQS